MGRRKSARTLLKEAVAEKDIEQWCWSVLEIHSREIDTIEEDKTIRSQDVFSIVRQLVALQKEKRINSGEGTDGQSEQDKELAAWTAAPKRQKT